MNPIIINFEIKMHVWQDDYHQNNLFIGNFELILIVLLISLIVFIFSILVKSI